MQQNHITENIEQGQIVWGNLSPTIGNEQSGYRPLLVISSDSYLQIKPSIIAVLPITTRSKNWISHIPITIDQPSYIMVEQITTISIERIVKVDTKIVSTAILERIKEIFGYIML